MTQDNAGRRLNLVRTGPRGGPPVVFLHAAGLDLSWWDHQFATLGHRHDLVAFDLPGHGLSEPLDVMSFEALADLVAEVIAGLKAGPAHVVGISVGGMIAQALTLMHPDHVRSLTLVATLCTLPPSVRDAMRERSRLAREEGMSALVAPTLERWFPPLFRASRPDILDRAAKSLLRQDSAVYAAVWEMIAMLDLKSRLSRITCPTLVISGAMDGNAPAAAGQEIADLIGGARLAVLQGIGHLPPLEAPTVFGDLLHAQLDR